MTDYRSIQSERYATHDEATAFPQRVSDECFLVIDGLLKSPTDGSA